MSRENIVWHTYNISKSDRAKAFEQKPCVLWFTGLSGSGKSTIANAVEEALFDRGNKAYLLDGDNIRHGLNKDLGFSDEDRIENIRRIGEVVKLFVDSGLIVLTTFISPFLKDRENVRSFVDHDEFIEIYIDTPFNVCEQRDPKGLYEKAKKGIIKNFTGVDSPYEAPKNPEIHIKTEDKSIGESANQIINYLVLNGYINDKNN